MDLETWQNFRELQFKTKKQTAHLIYSDDQILLSAVAVMGDS
jgi:hypothetical protein